MSYPTISFKQLLHAFARDVGRRPEALTPDEEAQFAHRLTDAVDWAWHYMTGWSLPEQVTGETLTVGAGGIIAAATIDHSRAWSVWAADPRVPNANPVPNKIAANEIDGNLRVDAAEGDEVFVIYRNHAPEFTAEVFANGTAYDFGALIWAKDSDVPDVFRCIDPTGSNTEGTDNADVWQAERLPKTFQKAVHLYAVAEQAGLDDDKPARAQALMARADTEMQELALRVRGDNAVKFWLNNHNI